MFLVILQATCSLKTERRKMHSATSCRPCHSPPVFTRWISVLQAALVLSGIDLAEKIVNNLAGYFAPDSCVVCYLL